MGLLPSLYSYDLFCIWINRNVNVLIHIDREPDSNKPYWIFWIVDYIKSLCFPNGLPRWQRFFDKLRSDLSCFFFRNTVFIRHTAAFSFEASFYKQRRWMPLRVNAILSVFLKLPMRLCNRSHPGFLLYCPVAEHFAKKRHQITVIIIVSIIRIVSRSCRSLVHAFRNCYRIDYGWQILPAVIKYIDAFLLLRCRTGIKSAVI